MNGASSRRASGIVRTLVVASATLAILLVCFSIYQYSQLVDPELVEQYEQRAEPAEVTTAPPPETDPNAVGVKVGPVNAPLGGGQRISLTLYPREGTRAAGEVNVLDYAPVEGSPNELKLAEPEFRLRTRQGYTIRATATDGHLEVQRRATGGYDPQRGRLVGNVVIEIDRRTDEERALPSSGAESPGARKGQGAVPAAALVRVELEEIEFDLEYARVVIPGAFHLSAVDVDLRAPGLEVRFNEAENRVDYLRIEPGGGRLELREGAEGMNLSVPGMGGPATKQLTLVERLRGTVQRQLAARAQAAQQEQEVKPQPGQRYVTDEGEPVVLPDRKEQAAPSAAVKYYARFEEEVDASQMRGEERVSRLEADLLEIVRDFGEDDREALTSGKPAAEGETGATPTADAGQTPAVDTDLERIILTWTGRLVLEALPPGDERITDVERTRIIAHGAPGRVSHPDGAASFGRLAYEPDAGSVWFDESSTGPAVVHSAEQGSLSGRQIHFRRVGEEMYVRVVGPGMATRDPAEEDWRAAETENGADDTDVAFDGTLEVFGRIVADKRVDFTGTTTTRELRILDQTKFTGGVRMKQDDRRLSAETLTLDFAPSEGRHQRHQRIERMRGTGGVVLAEGVDQLSCRELDTLLTVDARGKPVPLTATAMGEVSATQGERTIEARDKLIVDFELVSVPPPPFDLMKAYAAAAAAGEDVEQIDWETRRRAHEADVRPKAGVKRLQGFGGVRVVDPTQGLDLSAEELDCNVVNGREIEIATIKGAEGKPASVQLGSFTVTGQPVRLNVPDQWAEVPGPGHLTFRSYKDLDGRRLSEPIPIAVTWEEGMRYRGRENWASFAGNVHAASENETEFDCKKLVIEFDDVQPATQGEPPSADWWIFQDLADQLAREGRGDPAPWEGSSNFSKEPAHIVATGGVTAKGADYDTVTGELKSRARIQGPKLSVNLRQEVSKMLIEGPGTLLLEDFRPADEQAAKSRTDPGFSLDAVAGPSKTLIVWQEFMWYDFSIHQARFQRDVEFKHFSGIGLKRLSATKADTSPGRGEGRATFLECDALTADFMGGTQEVEMDQKRFGSISGARLKRFQASGDVRLIDEIVGFWAVSDVLTFERARGLLTLEGRRRVPAEIVLQQPGKLPYSAKSTSISYDIPTGRIESRDFSAHGATP